MTSIQLQRIGLQEQLRRIPLSERYRIAGGAEPAEVAVWAAGQRARLTADLAALPHDRSHPAPASRGGTSIPKASAPVNHVVSSEVQAAYEVARQGALSPVATPMVVPQPSVATVEPTTTPSSPSGVELMAAAAERSNQRRRTRA